MYKHNPWIVMIPGLTMIAGLLTQPLTADERPTRPHRVVEPLALSEVRWTDGFWHQRIETNRQSTIPAMWDIMRGTHYKPYWEHFRIAAGLSTGRYRGAAFNDGDFYKWIEAVCAQLAVSHDPSQQALLTEIITVIGQAQRADGYLHTPVLVAHRNGDLNVKPFGDRFNFEMYNLGHLMTAACLHHQVTGQDQFLSIACHAADFLDREFQNPTAEQARHAVCPSHYMGIIELYRATGQTRYLELAQRLMQMRDQVVDGGDDNQDRVPFTQQTEAVGHAVRATYLYAGMADLYAETGNRQVWQTLHTLWENLVQKKMFITGGCGALYDGASPDGAEQQQTITRVHQAFGRNYQLPNTTAYNETCANIGNVLWNWRMFLASGEAKYIDVLELALYNAVLAGVSLEGSDFFYTNPLRQTAALPTELRWSRTRVPYVTSYCCPPNVARTIAQVNGYAYARSARTIWCNLYGNNSLDTSLGEHGRVRLQQESDYPWSGQVRITVLESDGRPLCLKLRIPSWASGAAVKIDGQPVTQPVILGNYLSLERTWAAGATVELELAMPVQVLEAHPLVEENRNQVAIKRGPLVYCLESHDLVAGISLSDVYVPEQVQLQPQFRADLLGGVHVLEGQLRARSSQAWDGQLYRALEPTTAVPVQVQLIPYYAWSNRGPSEMSVWLPLD